MGTIVAENERDYHSSKRKPGNGLQEYGKNEVSRKKTKNFLENVWRNEKSCIFAAANEGALAQLARALAWHARGHRFDSVMLHKTRNPLIFGGFCRFLPFGVPFLFT